MRTLFWFFVLIALVAVRCHAEGPQNAADVAKFEIARRGNHVEQTGTIRSGLKAAALAPPADDSGKWFITLIYKPGDADSEAMRNTIAHDPDVRAWIDAGDPHHSVTHYQERSVTDATQRDWLAAVQSAIEKGGLPVVLLQPPLSGKFGPPKTIVKTLHGKMTGRNLVEKLTDAVLAYVETLESSIGVQQPSSGNPVGVAPPFNVQPPAAPAPPVQPPADAPTPFEWPPSKPKALTIDQISAACPGAPPEFILSQVSGGQTNLEIVKLSWLVYQQGHKPPPDVVPELPAAVVPECPTNPTKPANGMPSAETLAYSGLMAALIAGIAIGLWLGLWILKALDARRVTNGEKTVAHTSQYPNLSQYTTTPSYYPASEPQSGPPANQSVAPAWRPPNSNANGSTTNG